MGGRWLRRALLHACPPAPPHPPSPPTHPHTHPLPTPLRTRSGDVRVNWRAGAKPSVDVKAGDVISCAGKGRVEVREAALTKKGKWAVQLVRYL